MTRVFFVLGSVSAALAVALGAFAAHGLRGRVAPDMLAVFETAARYHMYHALALGLAATGAMFTIQHGQWILAGALSGAGCLPAPDDAQTATEEWVHPRTAWGDPDLSGLWPIDHMNGTMSVIAIIESYITNTRRLRS